MLASAASGSSVEACSGCAWKSAPSAGTWSTAICSAMLSARPPASQRLASSRGPSAEAVADWQLSTLNQQHIASSVKVSLRTRASGAPSASRQANQPKVSAAIVGAIRATRPSSARSSRAASRGTGRRRISWPSGGSITRFTVTVPSVTMLIHRICTAASGIGRPASSASSSTASAAIEVENR